MKLPILIFFAIFSSSLFGQFLFERSDFIDVYKNSNLKKLPWTGGMNFVQFSNIDLDYDGNNDLFVFDRSSNKIMTFKHSGNAGTVEYTYAPEFEADFPELTQWVLLRDYNCDGKMDIFAYTGGGINVFKNTGNASSGLSFERMTIPYLFTIIYGNPYNLYVSGGDIPGIYDVDGDGDLDVLTFGQSGNRVEYHKNYSMEMYGVCDSLNTYELRNECWGRFTESDVTNQLNLWDTLNYPCDGTSSIVNPELVGYDFDLDDVTEIIPMSRNRHVGSTVMPFDNNDDGITDLLIGDVTYNNLVYTENYGTAVNTNSGMGYQEVNFPSNTTPVDVAVFPAGFYVDINMDGTSELIASPNYTSNSVDMESVWYYENNGTTTAPIFAFSSNEFLQGDMIDVGLGAYPVFFDHDGDGLKDLIIANAYYFNKTDQTNYSRLAYFKNTGTVSAPEFTFVTNNYANLENTGLQLHIYPSFADMDTDGDEDMYIGDLNGGIHYYENTAGAGNPAVFAAPVLNITDAVGAPIDVGQYSTPTLKDINRDGLIDMVIGCKLGQLYYYENTGTLTSPKFTYQTDNFGGVNTTATSAVYGYSVPSFVDHNGEYELFLGSFSGYLHYYTDIDANLSGNFTLVDTLYQGIQDGKQSGVAVEDLDGDGNYELYYGTKRGGLTLYESNQDLGIEDINLLEDDFNVYPNPTKNNVVIDFTNSINNFYGNDIELYNAVGQMIVKKKISSNKILLDLNQMSEGIYILSVKIEGVRINKKIIKQ